jgi:uncharacterized Tic20 family protein
MFSKFNLNFSSQSSKFISFLFNFSFVIAFVISKSNQASYEIPLSSSEKKSFQISSSIIFVISLSINLSLENLQTIFGHLGINHCFLNFSNSSFSNKFLKIFSLFAKSILSFKKTNFSSFHFPFSIKTLEKAFSLFFSTSSYAFAKAILKLFSFQSQSDIQKITFNSQ